MFQETVQKLLDEFNMSKSDLSRQSGIPYTTIDGWFKKGCENIRINTLLKLAAFFNVSVDYLIGAPSAVKISVPELRLLTRYRQLDTHGRHMVELIASEELGRAREQTEEAAEIEEETEKTIPLFLTMAAAGYAAPVEGVDVKYIKHTKDIPRQADFAMLIDGDSMEPYIKNGDVVYCMKDSEGLKVGDVGIFNVDGALYCKQYVTDGENVYLISLNRSRSDADITLWGSGNRSLKLEGRVLLDKKIPKP